MKRPRHWIKLWVAWLDNPAHRDLSEGAFGLGPLLLLMCTWDGTYEGGGWLLAEDGSPMSAMALMRETHRVSRGRLNSQIAELIKCKTMVQREDGALGFPNYGKWQETKAAERMRLKREREREQLANSSTQCSPQTTDDRREQQHASHAGQPPAAKRDSKPPDPFAEATTTVLRALNDARCSVTPGLTALRKRDHIRARLAEGTPVEHLLAVIAFAADECRRDPAKLQWLDAVTPFRPKNWESRLARAQAWQATSSRQSRGQRFDATPDQLHRERQERLAAIAAEENA